MHVCFPFLKQIDFFDEFKDISINITVDINQCTKRQSK